jgi:hypothetical protein
MENQMVLLSLTITESLSVKGTYVKERGGPIREGEADNSVPATYFGSIVKKYDGKHHIYFNIRITDSNANVGTFFLIEGNQGRVVKCL